MLLIERLSFGSFNKAGLKCKLLRATKILLKTLLCKNESVVKFSLRNHSLCYNLILDINY